ncbi:phage regulatory CII family protein [Sphingomonas sp. ABOLE]|uniref:phage regulatory CII family protein n=1 Tax=Sphingomonas sp. ABOLE TaxID=1985878 RepID=UPI0013E03999|nr:phage regulatory CII family protein [Sphingomonas sp. ABOLE]
MSEQRNLTLGVAEQELKSAERALIREFGGQVAAGEHFRRPQSRYSDCGNAATRVHLTVQEVAELEDNTNGRVDHPIVTRHLARRQGFELVGRPRALPTEGNLMLASGDLVKEAGDVVSSIGRALADRKLDARERAEIRGEIDQLIEVAVTLGALVDAAADGEVL